jgi:hypothetical protein
LVKLHLVSLITNLGLFLYMVHSRESIFLDV